MGLINQMIVDNNGGVCLRKNLTYNTYNSLVTGCTCNDIIISMNENIYLGIYILPYKNVNPRFEVNVLDESKCLNLIDIEFKNWINYYINALVTTGYTGYNGSISEQRIIFDEINNKYYQIKQTNEELCHEDKTSRYAIVDYTTETMWAGIGNYYYSELDNCDNETGIKFVKTKDINPISPTYGQIQINKTCF